MSWSKGFIGTAKEAAAETEKWAREIAEIDEKYLLGPIAREGHQLQIKLAKALFEILHESHGEKVLSYSAYGHAGDNGTGNVGVSYNEAPPLPQHQAT